MKGVIRVVLVDPRDESRQALQRILSGIDTIWVLEVCTAYQAAAKVISDHRPDLSLVVMDGDPEQALGLIQAVVRANPEAIVLPASAVRDSETILRAVRAGAREFLTLPVEVDELLAAIERLVRPRDPLEATSAKVPRVIAVAGATGGVGCTTLAVNLATTLAGNPDQSVLLVDFDLFLGSVDTYLDIASDHTLFDVTQQVDRLDMTLLKRSLTRHPSGLYILPRPAAMEDADKIGPEALRRLLVLLRASFDTIVIDTSKGLHAPDFLAMEMADAILLIIQLDLICLRNTARFLDMLKHFEVPPERIRVIINGAEPGAQEISLRKAEETLKTTIRCQVPNAWKVLSAARVKGVPIATEAPGSRIHRVVEDIARDYLTAGHGGKQPRRRRGPFAALF